MYQEKKVHEQLTLTSRDRVFRRKWILDKYNIYKLLTYSILPSRALIFTVNLIDLQDVFSYQLESLLLTIIVLSVSFASSAVYSVCLMMLFKSTLHQSSNICDVISGELITVRAA